MRFRTSRETRVAVALEECTSRIGFLEHRDVEQRFQRARSEAPDANGATMQSTAQTLPRAPMQTALEKISGRIELDYL